MTLQRTRQPDLSVIILTYNTRDLTRLCVQSVLSDAAETASDIEIVIVDNGSTDGTSAWLREGYPHIRLIEIETNLGFARGNNAGLAAARGRYLMLLNSDTQIQPGALAALIAFMDSHPDAGACGPMLLNRDGSVQPSGRPLPGVWSVFIGMTRLYRLWKRDFYAQRGRDYQHIVRVGEVSGAALLVRREVYERVGGLDPGFFAYYEDVDWCKRIGAARYAIYYVPTAQVRHFWEGTSRTAGELAYRAGQDSLRYYFAKHHGRLAHLAVQVLLIARELVLLVAALFQRNRVAWRAHREYLSNALRRLNVDEKRTEPRA